MLWIRQLTQERLWGQGSRSEENSRPQKWHTATRSKVSILWGLSVARGQRLQVSSVADSVPVNQDGYGGAGGSRSRSHRLLLRPGPAAATPPPVPAACAPPPSPPSAPAPPRTGRADLAHPHPRGPHGPASGAPQAPGLTAACHPSGRGSQGWRRAPVFFLAPHAPTMTVSLLIPWRASGVTRLCAHRLTDCWHVPHVK